MVSRGEFRHLKRSMLYGSLGPVARREVGNFPKMTGGQPVVIESLRPSERIGPVRCGASTTIAVADWVRFKQHHFELHYPRVPIRPGSCRLRSAAGQVRLDP